MAVEDGAGGGGGFWGAGVGAGVAMLGAVGAKAGGAKPLRPVARVVFWGALAMGLTAAIGSLVGTSV